MLQLQVGDTRLLSRLGQGLGKDACHCMHCNACMALSEFPHHKCRDLSTCPVCTEYLFDSAQPYRVGSESENPMHSCLTCFM